MKIAIIGLGAIGSYLLEKIEEDDSLKFVSAYDLDKEKRTVPSVKKLLETKPDLVVEAAGFEVVRDYAEQILSKTDLLIMSTSAFAYPEIGEKILKTTREKGTKYHIPGGAIIGLDGINTVAGELTSVEIETRKNPNGFSREDETETVLFEGTARNACKEFPRNVNIAATVSLNGIGFDKTTVKIISDPEITVNTHTVRAEGSFGRFTIKVEGVPSINPKTSALAGMSAFQKIKEIQALKK